MPECQGCGAKVSNRYAKVMWSDEKTVPACPECDDAKMVDGKRKNYRI